MELAERTPCFMGTWAIELQRGMLSLGLGWLGLTAAVRGAAVTGAT